MGQEALPDDAIAPDPVLALRENGTLVHGGMAIGRVEPSPNPGAPARLVLNLGWLRAAGMSITVQGDPDVDRKRSGVVLER